jgi:threonine synthase
MELIYSEYLAKRYHANIFLKPEWGGETGSHKDMWAASAIQLVKEKNYKKVVVMSSGNLGLAIAAKARREHIDCVVITWGTLPKEYVPLFEKWGAHLIQVKDGAEESVVFEKYVRNGYFPLSLTATQREVGNLPGIEGYKVVVDQIVASLHRMPDVVILPAGFGDLAQGIFDGFKEMKGEHLPQFILVRARFPEGSLARSIAVNETTPSVQSIVARTGGKAYSCRMKTFSTLNV